MDTVTTNYRKHKSAVTRAKKKGPDAVLSACDDAIASFDSAGWPDDWAWFQRAADDARFGARYYY